MGLGELYYSILLLNSIALQHATVLHACTLLNDPTYCYEYIPSRLDMQDALLWWDPPSRLTPSQFYHYKDPQPLPHTRADVTCPPSTPQTCK